MIEEPKKLSTSFNPIPPTILGILQPSLHIHVTITSSSIELMNRIDST